MVINGNISKVAGKPGILIHMEVLHESGTRYLLSVADLGGSELLGARYGALAITWWRWPHARSGLTGIFDAAPYERQVRDQFGPYVDPDSDVENAHMVALTSIIRSIFGARHD